MNALTMNNILFAVCRYYKIEPIDLFKVDKKRYFTEKRMMFIYLCFDKIPGITLKDMQGFISRNGRNEIMNHGSIIHSRGLIKSIIEYNRVMKYDSENIMKNVKYELEFIPLDVYLLALCKPNI